MGYYHSLTLATKLRDGVTKEQVEQALEPVIGAQNHPENFRLEIDQETRRLEFESAGDVSNSFAKDVAIAASKMGPLVAEPCHMTLYDGDANFGEEPSYFYIGDSPETIQKAQIERLSESVIGLAREILDVPGGAEALPELVTRIRLAADQKAVATRNAEAVNRETDKKRAAAKPAPGPAL